MKIAICCMIILLQEEAISASIRVNKPVQNVAPFLRTPLIKKEESLEDKRAKISLIDGIVKYGCDGTRVAFHAFLSGSRCYHTGDTFKFDEAPVNKGVNGREVYDTNSGVFVAPVTGLYAFTCTVAAEKKTWFSARLMVNGDVKGIVMADADVEGGSAGIHPATGFVLTNVKACAHVLIRFYSRHGCTVKSDGLTRSSFTGWLMNRATAE